MVARCLPTWRVNGSQSDDCAYMLMAAAASCAAGRVPEIDVRTALPTQPAIDTLPPLPNVTNVEEELPNENGCACAICLDDFEAGDGVRKLPRCGHVLPKECGDRWFRTVASCPICKTDLAVGEGANASSASASAASS
mmetsp:Transcript_22914/g.47665  ORF Transcript_22914/g.47665 Transcript_22914/m.47665 type:complete len:138 (-) Transcript_22914:509-922(-)